MTEKRGPLSVDELLEKKRKEKEAHSKPRFLSRADRAKLASNHEPQPVNTLEKPPKREGTVSTTSTASSVRTTVKPTETRDVKVARKSKDNNVKSFRGTKFQFDWKQDDDTFEQDDSIYGYWTGAKQPSSTESMQGPGYEERLRRLKQRAEQRKNIRDQDLDDIPWFQKPLDAMTTRDWRVFKESYRIVSRGGNLPNPIRSWSESSVPKPILDVVNSLGYKEPTPVQRAAIPVALSLRDVIGVAETGSGKTASFVVPLLSYVMDLPKLTKETFGDGPYALILAPTRELALQIEQETRKFCEPLGFKCASLVGGHSVEMQAMTLDEGAEIIIGTPGRLVDFLERHFFVLSQCCYLVLDEADRMIDFGFEEQIQKILDEFPKENAKRKRLTMMYTATWPKSIQSLADTYLDNPGYIQVGGVGAATDRVKQELRFISDEDKRKDAMLAILSSRQFAPPIIVFANTKKMCETIFNALVNAKRKAAVMHGGKTQDQREAALAKLRSGEIDVLVATDVAGRGIDVSNVSLVLNFQMPFTIEAYTHRIGRTGRAGKTGTAITFLGKDDEELFYDLRQMLAMSPISKAPQELLQNPASHKRPTKKRAYENDQDE